MKELSGRIAVVTGGGSGMERELVRLLVAEGCHVAMCDVSASAMAETARLCEADRPPQGTRVTAHVADVSDEAQVRRFQGEVAISYDTDKIHLLFNNAGIAGGGSFVSDPREQIVGVVTAVGDDMAAFEAIEQLGSSLQVVGLAGGEDQADWQAILVHDSVDLGA